MLTFENKAFRDIAANAPYDVVEILVNSATYGGGGIFGLYSTVAADSAWAPYIFVHEFGHHIAGLADEYYTSDVAYLPAADRVEPWEPNATALLDPSNLKWKDLVTAGTPKSVELGKGEPLRIPMDQLVGWHGPGIEPRIVPIVEQAPEMGVALELSGEGRALVDAPDGR